MTDQRRQPADTPVIKSQTIFRRRKLEERFRCDHSQITLHGQLQAGTDGGAIDGADDRHRRRIHGLVQLDEPVGIVGRERVTAQVGAGAEHRALPGQHNRAGGPVGPFTRLLQGLPQLLYELGIQGIAALGALQLNCHHGFGLGNTDHRAKPI